MRKSRGSHSCILIGLLLFVAPAIVLAAPDPPPGDDLIGIYVIPTDTTMFANLDVAGPYPQLVNLLMILTRCSAYDGISAWECAIEEPDGVSIWYNVPGGVNVAEPPEFAVGLYSPSPRSMLMTLASVSVFVMDGNPKYFKLHPVSQNPTIPGSIVYARGYNINEFITMHWSSGDEDLPVFGINTGPLQHIDGRTIKTEPSSWGRVKALYR